MARSNVGLPAVCHEVVERLGQIVLVRQHQYALRYIHYQRRFRILLVEPVGGQLAHLFQLHRHKHHALALDCAVELLAAGDKRVVYLAQPVCALAELFDVRFRLVQLGAYTLIQHAVGQQLVLNAVHKHARACARDVELAFQARVILVG